MAARRLLIVMVILLVISSLAAALVPPPPEESSTTTSTTQQEPESEPTAPSGRELSRTISAQAPEPREVRLHTGDQLSLTVTSRRFAEVTVPRLGLLEIAEAGAPARFNILIQRPGDYHVRTLEPERVVARVVARKPEPSGDVEADGSASRSARSGER